VGSNSNSIAFYNLNSKNFLPPHSLHPIAKRNSSNLLIKRVGTRELKAHMCGKCMQTNQGTGHAHLQWVHAHMVSRQLHLGAK